MRLTDKCNNRCRLGLCHKPVFKRQMGGNFITDIFSGKTATKIKNAIPSLNPGARPGFPGEMHQILMLPNGPGVANFSGPGTQVIKRLKRGDKPRSRVDQIAKRHDLEYSLITNNKEARQADKTMLKALKKARKLGLDNKTNINVAQAGIEAKVLGEKVGVLSRDLFIKPTTLNSSQKDMIQNELDKMAQKGAGKPKKKMFANLKRDLFKQSQKMYKVEPKPIPKPKRKGGKRRKMKPLDQNGGNFLDTMLKGINKKIIKPSGKYFKRHDKDILKFVENVAPILIKTLI